MFAESHILVLGFVSYISAKTGSYYIESLKEMFLKHHKTLDVARIMARVNINNDIS